MNAHNEQHDPASPVVKQNLTTQPAAAQEAVAWAVYGQPDEWPEPVLLADYVGSMEVIRKRVMDGAIREGFKGDFVERMAELGWWLEPLVLAAPVTAAPADLIERCREILAWQRTGVLPGDALRAYANARWPDEHDPLQIAEKETAREAFRILARAAAASTPAAPGIDMGVHGATLTIDGKTFTVDEVRAALDAQPASVVPSARVTEPLRADESRQEQADAAIYNRGWNDCRAAMLKHSSASPGTGLTTLADRITDHLCEHEYDIGGRDELLRHVREAIDVNHQDDSIAIKQLLPPDVWPQWADRHVWDANGQGWFYGAFIEGDGEGLEWNPELQQSGIAMPPEHDWRNPVFRTKAYTSDASPKGVTFRNGVDSEAQFIADEAHLNCPACGGSGHVEDSPKGGSDARHAVMAALVEAATAVERADADGELTDDLVDRLRAARDAAQAGDAEVQP